jgi:DNA (cytosine-5)-methyltransferase 1
MTKKNNKIKFKFIDLFAGIGGFHTSMHYVGGKCVFASEWDKNARISYEANYKSLEPDLFKKDKNEYVPRLYNLPEFQELLEYIKTTLE